VLEATTNKGEVAELILAHVAKVAIANPLKVKAIAEGKIKTDKIDAEVLARSCFGVIFFRRYGFRIRQPACYVRCALIAPHWSPIKRESKSHSIQSLLAQRLIPVPVSLLFNGRGRNWLSHLEFNT
jgi:transposase